MVSQHLRFRAVSLAVAWILPCWVATVVASVPGNAQTNEILSVSVAAEARDTVTFDVVYTYRGDHGNNVFMSVVGRGGEASDHFRYRLGRVQAGHQRTRVELSANAGAPGVFSTNQIEVGMFVDGRDPFIKRTFTFQKTWSKAGAGLPLAVSDGGSSSGQRTGSGGVVRRVLPGGQIELRYPDGTIRQRYVGGETIIQPDGTRRTFAFEMAQPGTPPS